MKKLLLILLCVPLLFISCNKDDDTPGNNNNNNGTATFLENQDGTVWLYQDNWDSEGQQDNDDGYGYLNWDQIGFYSANNFMLGKSDGGGVNNPNQWWCLWFNEGGTTGMDGMYYQIVKNTQNELWIEYISLQEPYDWNKVLNKFTLISENQISFVTDVYFNDSTMNNVFGWLTPIYIKSNQNNLICQ